MKKVFLSSLAIAFAGLTAATANPIALRNSASATYIQQQTQQDTKTPVKLEELPDGVKATLQTDLFKEWIPSAAFQVKTADGKEYYQIDVKKGEELRSINLDKDGKVVK